MKGGGVGLEGRPRPVPLAPLLEEQDPIPTRERPSRPSHPLPATLAPTDRPASCLTSRLRVMRMRADQSAVGAVNRPLRLIAYKQFIQPLDFK